VATSNFRSGRRVSGYAQIGLSSCLWALRFVTG
jgi:hypothetical protein